MKKIYNDKISPEKRFIIKILLCSVYLIVITILSVCSYKIYQEKQNIKSWSEVSSADEYAYIEVSKMSEKFAYYSTNKKSIHFVIEEEETGAWHTYLIAIKDSDYSKYKEIIDYTYDRTDKVPKPIKVYGYPVVITDELKQMAIENITNFLPAENEVVITNDNFNDYLTNSYLDTTIEREDNFNILLFITVLILFIIVILFFITIFDKNKITSNIDDLVDELKEKYLKSKENNK
ncbi:MAG: hypothetical protein PUC82_03195 [bacterium]|nr:hypothetical protein [bacterium]